MRFAIIILLFLNFSSKAQQKLVLDEKDQDRYLSLGLANPDMLFIYDEETDMEYLIRKENENLFIIDSFISDAGNWGWVDFHESFSSNDTLYIKAYKHMSALNGFFIYAWNGQNLTGVGYEFENPNDGMVEYADSMLAIGNIVECVGTLHGVQYPYNEFDTWGFGLKIMEQGHALALWQYENKNYDSAVAIMTSAFEYWENGTMLGFTSESDFRETQKEGYNVWEDEQMKLWIGDYGLFLCLAKKSEKSIEINGYMNTIFPDSAGPYLQLGDSYFDWGKYEEAKTAYKKYADLMKKQGKEKNIPKRVKERSK